MNKLTKTAIAPIIGLSLFVSGCSTPAPESKPEYDQLDLIAWEQCLRDWLDDDRSLWFYKSEAVKRAMQSCEALKPVKK